MQWVQKHLHNEINDKCEKKNETKMKSEHKKLSKNKLKQQQTTANKNKQKQTHTHTYLHRTYCFTFKLFNIEIFGEKISLINI